MAQWHPGRRPPAQRSGSNVGTSRIEFGNSTCMKTFSSLALSLCMSAWFSGTVAANGIKTTVEVASVSDVKWTPLNPLRGDKGPKAATLWGDRAGAGPTGFLVKFVDGFSSPPHIHNVTYRGVVITGLVHNDDPDAAKMWMPSGSFWTQPAGEVHITAAKGRINLAYIEIDVAPYLVLPAEEAFDGGERPINVDASNIVWINPPGLPASDKGPKVTFLWGRPQDGRLSGAFIKLPVGFKSELHGDGALLRSVVIQGQISHQQSSGSDVEKLEPGSYFGSEGDVAHRLACDRGADCILYVRNTGKLYVIPAQLPK